MSRIHIKNGHIIDSVNQRNTVDDIYIADKKIISIGKTPDNFTADQTIDAANKIVCPGLVDICARLREPGEEHKATIESEIKAAAGSGITSLCIPPDTTPVINEPSIVELIQTRAEEFNSTKIYTLGALTTDLKGQQLAEMGILKAAGCVGVSNGLQPVKNDLVLKRALDYAAAHNLTVHISPQDHTLMQSGCAHEGEVATRLGLPSIPTAAETIAIAKCLLLIEETGTHVHFGRLSSAKSVDMIATAKQQGLAVTADVAAHSLHLSEHDIGYFNSQYHVIPPLRTIEDRDALIAGLRTGAIDAICSDHQPQDTDAKLAPFPSSAPGISALETLLPLTLRLVEQEKLELPQAIQLITANPSKIMGINAGELGKNAPADICIFDLETKWTFDIDNILSNGKNSPFIEQQFKGKISQVIIDGQCL